MKNLAPLALFSALAFCGCPPADTAPKEAPAAASEEGADEEGPDPRAAAMSTTSSAEGQAEEQHEHQHHQHDRAAPLREPRRGGSRTPPRMETARTARPRKPRDKAKVEAGEVSAEAAEKRLHKMRQAFEKGDE